MRFVLSPIADIAIIITYLPVFTSKSDISPGIGVNVQSIEATKNPTTNHGKIFEN